LNKKSWSKVETAGFLPGLLFHHASVMDAAGRLWLIGGVAPQQQDIQETHTFSTPGMVCF
jgi:hypothetical protein